MASERIRRWMFIVLGLFIGLMGFGFLGSSSLEVWAEEVFVHPDFVSGSREAPITLETIDALTQLPGDLGALPEVTVPKDNPMTWDKSELGKMLFFDPRLSGNGHWACATCHNPSLGFSDGLPRTLSFGDEEELGRHVPSLLNSAYNSYLFWDGRATSLEEQAVSPIQNVQEMNADPYEVLRLLNGIPEYRDRFMTVFGGPATLERIGKAIATFERTLVTRNAPFDRYMQGDQEALDTQQKQGLILFISKAACTQCHNGPNLTDNQFHNLGIPQAGPLAHDLGRYEITQDELDMGAFKTPGLRNIAMTPPYMHNGVFKSLEEVIEFYDRGAGENDNKSSKLLPLNLTDQEKKDLTAFLEALSGSLPIVSYPQLPRNSTVSLEKSEAVISMGGTDQE